MAAWTPLRRADAAEGPGTQADLLVLYGVTGDLARKMILPALYRLVERGALSVPVIGVARSDWSTEELRAHVRRSVTAALDDVEPAAMRRLEELVHLVAGDYADPVTFELVADAVHERAGHDVFGVHYLAVPPDMFGAVADGLAAAGLHRHARLVVEKPFGRDIESARKLDALLRRYFPDERIFRVDHYLGKEPVEDLLVLRFANTLLEPIWNRTWIDRIEITLAEDSDVAARGSFYDGVGAVRDVVQNHLLQVLAYLTMDAPCTDSADDQRDAKHRLLRAVRAVDPACVTRGQYVGYRDAPGVAPGSPTETYVELTLSIDNWRWSGVPVHVRAGKAMPKSLVDLAIVLRRPPQMLFAGTHGPPPPNRIGIRLQPDPGVTFHVLAKQPGSGNVATEVPLTVDFRQVLGPLQAPYERIFGDALTGDPSHFARMDNLEEAWRIVGPIIAGDAEPLPYAPGTWGPPSTHPWPEL